MITSCADEIAENQKVVFDVTDCVFTCVMYTGVPSVYIAGRLTTTASTRISTIVAIDARHWYASLRCVVSGILPDVSPACLSSAHT